MQSPELRPAPVYPSAPRSSTYEDGAEFLEFATREILRAKQLRITAYMSQRYQYGVGESHQGVEFKLCNVFPSSGRLSIEVFERSRCTPTLGWSPSGILRRDNTWLYVIGNRTMLFAFAAKTLVNMYAESGIHAEQTWCACHRTSGQLRGLTGTVSRFFVPLDVAYTQCAFVLDFRPRQPRDAVADDLPF